MELQGIKKNQCGVKNYGIREVYYRRDGTIEAMSENSIIPHGETLEELKKDILMQLQAFEKPALDFDEWCKDNLNIDKIDS